MSNQNESTALTGAPGISPRQATETMTQIFTGIPSLDVLLASRGIRYLSSHGFFGVLFGSAGSGKSLLSLQVCCGYAWNALNSRHAKNSHPCAIYLTQEPPALILHQVREFQYFGYSAKGSRKRALFAELDRFETSSADQRIQVHCLKRNFDWTADCKDSRLYVIQMPLEQHAQTDKLINLFDVVTHHRQLVPADHCGNPLLICVDNAETICREAYLELFRIHDSNPCQAEILANQERDFYKLLRSHLAFYGINSFFVFEEPPGVENASEPFDAATTAQAYAADLVIHLGFRTCANGYRERVLEIVKAKNQFYHRGKHHFSIVPAGRQDPRGSGVVVYPSLATQLHQIRFPSGASNASRGKGTRKPRGGGGLGIESLDREVQRALARGNLEHTDSAVGKRQASSTLDYIKGGSTSVLVSDLDEKATEIALHFALGVRPGMKSLYVSFHQPLEDLRTAGCRFSALKSIIDDGLRTDQDAACRLLYLPAEQISESKLLQDIDMYVQGRQRVVLDNIFAFHAKFPLVSNVDHFLASLLALFKVRRIASLVVDTVEVGEGRNPIEKSTLAGLVDNVFLLRHIELHSRPRSVFSVLKVQAHPTPERIWELQETSAKGENGSRIVALPTFDFYRDVLIGRPTPVRFSMGLFRDAPDSPLEQYLKAQRKALQQTLGEAIRIELYGPEEYVRMQRTISFSQVRPLADCHIVAIDEFWLNELIKNGFLENLNPHLQQAQEFHLADRDQYVTAAHDVALLFWKKDSLNKEILASYRFALPVRNNCGVLCYKGELVAEFLTKGVVDPRVDAANSLRCKAHEWIESLRIRATASPWTWSELARLRPLWHQWAQHSNVTEMPETFFTFCMDLVESCVSFLLELALGTLRDPSALFHGTKKPHEPRTLRIAQLKMPLNVLFGLLEESDLERLADGRLRRSADEPRAFFSRQWLSTLGCLRAREHQILSEESTREESSCADQSPADRREGTEETGNLVQEVTRRSESDRAESRWFLRLEPHELPLSAGGRPPTPVSGVWYLGILKGSVAVAAGVQVIGQFCSLTDDEQKLRQFMGLPVRRLFYESPQSESPFRLPYAQQFIQIAEAQQRMLTPKNKPSARYKTTVLNSTCPFYRMQIANYSHLAPILWRMVQHAAAGVLGSKTAAQRQQAINKAVANAEGQWRLLDKELRRHANAD